jgi:isopentenyldiphosphate isomerase
MTPHTCRLDNYSGAVSLDDGEVAETRWMQLEELRQHADQHPEEYTQWFLDEIHSLGWFHCKDGQQIEDGQPAQGRRTIPAVGQQQLAGAAN